MGDGSDARVVMSQLITLSSGRGRQAEQQVGGLAPATVRRSRLLIVEEYTASENQTGAAYQPRL